MSTMNQITGGAFTDFENNPLAGGYIVLELSHDEQNNSNAQVVGGLRLKIQLDTNGNIPTTPATSVWPNDVLLPAGSFYTVEAFRSDGTRAWRAPQYWTITSSPSPLNVGTLIPTNPPVSGATLGTLTLQTNSVNNGSQSKLNLRSLDSSVTLTDDGVGDVNIQVTNGATSAAFMLGAGIFSPLGCPTASFGAVTSSALKVAVTRFTTPFSLTSFNTLSFYGRSSDGSGSTNLAFGIYNSSQSLLWSSGVINLAGSSFADHTYTVSSLTISPGIYYLAATSDNLNVFVSGLSLAQISADNTSSAGNVINQHSITFGYAVTAAAAGPTLPAAMGGLTSYLAGDGTLSPIIFLEKV